MYLIITDSFAITKEAKYFFARDKWIEQIKEHYPDYKKLTLEDIDEILVVGMKSEEPLHAKTAQCVGYTAADDTLRIDYGSFETIDQTSKEISTRRWQYYRFSKKCNNIFPYPPPVMFVENINDFNRIKNGIGKIVVNQNLLSSLEEKHAANDWKGIIQSCPRMSELPNDPIWNDPQCLSIFGFAKNKIALNVNKKHTPEDFKKQKEAEKDFYLICNRCMELEPYSSKHKSTMAYYLYERYISVKKKEYFEQAKPYFEDLIESSEFKFKELYRYCHLMRIHFDVPDNKYATDSYKELNYIIQSYEHLMELYDTLDDKQKSSQKNHYYRGKYQFVELICETSFKRYWDVYIDKKLQGTEPPLYLLTSEKMAMLKKCANLIRDVMDYWPDEPRADNVNDKPSYFNIRYRAAQIAQFYGLFYLLNGYDEDKYAQYFSKSRDIIAEMLSKAHELSQSGIRFNFPHYLKPTQAINMYFLHDQESCFKQFSYKDRAWVKFEHARLCLLYGMTDEALSLLQEIPDSDLSYNKASKLIERLEGTD